MESPDLVRVFISHASPDVDLADALVQLLRSALPLSERDIRCTSVPGYTLKPGADTDGVLRDEVSRSTVCIGLLTPCSLNSPWVLFELGARWGINRPLFPLLAGGADREALRGPLAEKNVLQATVKTEVQRTLTGLAHELDLTRSSPESYERALDAFVQKAAVPSVPTAPGDRPPEVITTTRGPHPAVLAALGVAVLVVGLLIGRVLAPDALGPRSTDGVETTATPDGEPTLTILSVQPESPYAEELLRGGQAVLRVTVNTGRNEVIRLDPSWYSPGATPPSSIGAFPLPDNAASVVQFYFEGVDASTNVRTGVGTHPAMVQASELNDADPPTRSYTLDLNGPPSPSNLKAFSVEYVVGRVRRD